MNTLQKVAHYTGYSIDFLNRNAQIEEWASIYYLHIKGNRPQFLSKKMVDRAAKIECIPTIAGDKIINDRHTNKFYILREPGYYCGSDWSIKELKIKPKNIFVDFADFSGTITKIDYKTTKRQPQNLRELYTLLSIRTVA